MTDLSSPDSQESPEHDGGPDELVGTVIADRYRILEPIGSGGMGQVYRAEQVTLGKVVAVKVLKREYCDQKIYLERFLQEARAASQIGHDNVVDIIDFGRIPGGSAFFVMEFLAGEDLDEVLDREGMLPWHRVRSIVQQVTRALGAAHAKGIIHRDMKPANCFLVQHEDGVDHIKVFDFGIAKVRDLNTEGTGGLTQTGAIFGTAKYMAPEQARGEKVDQRTDVYALGITLYELLTGQVPFPGENFMQVLTAHLTDPVPPPRSVAPDADISEAVEAVVMRCLAKDPAERYQSMAEFEAALLAVDGVVRATTGNYGTAVGRVAATMYNPDVDLSQLTRPPGAGRKKIWAFVGTLVVAGGVLAAVFGPQIVSRDTPPATAESTAEPAKEEAGPAPGPVLGAAASVTPEVSEPVFPTQPTLEPVVPPAAEEPPPEPDPPPATRRATTPRQRPRRKPTKPSGPGEVGPEGLTEVQIQRALGTIDPAVKSCRSAHGGLRGMIVKVRFMVSKSTGRVSSASAEKPHRGTPLGSCVARAVKKAKFPRGELRILTRKFTL